MSYEIQHRFNPFKEMLPLTQPANGPNPRGALPAATESTRSMITPFRPQICGSDVRGDLKAAAKS